MELSALQYVDMQITEAINNALRTLSSGDQPRDSLERLCQSVLLQRVLRGVRDSRPVAAPRAEGSH
jgi:hypothetical protein